METNLTASSAIPVAERLLNIDFMRGLALCLMTLEHVTPFVNVSMASETYMGQPPYLPSWPLMLSGLATNLAAPTFWMLAGTSIALFEKARRRKGVSEWLITRFLLIRASLLIILDLTLGTWLWADQQGNVHVLISLAIGIALLSLMRSIPLKALAIGGVSVILSYQALIYFIPNIFRSPSNYLEVILLTGGYKWFPNIEFPIMGWLGLMLMGYVLGRNLEHPIMKKPKGFFMMGILLLAVWLVLRLVGKWGDFMPYDANTSWAYFFVMSKLPLSLTDLSFNIGLVFILMAVIYCGRAWLDHPLARPIITLGRTSLFFFVTHIAFTSLGGWVIMSFGGNLQNTVRTYASFIIAMILLLPITSIYGRLRKRYPRTILQYM